MKIGKKGTTYSIFEISVSSPNASLSELIGPQKMLALAPLTFEISGGPLRCANRHDASGPSALD